MSNSKNENMRKGINGVGGDESNDLSASKWGETNGIGWSEEIRRRANVALGKQKVNLKNAFQSNSMITNSESKKNLSPLLTLN